MVNFEFVKTASDAPTKLSFLDENVEFESCGEIER